MPQVPKYADAPTVGRTGLPGVQVRAGVTAGMAQDAMTNTNAMTESMVGIGRAITGMAVTAEKQERDAKTKLLDASYAADAQKITTAYSQLSGVEATAAAKAEMEANLEGLRKNYLEQAPDETRRMALEASMSGTQGQAAARMDTHYWGQADQADRMASKAQAQKGAMDMVANASQFAVINSDGSPNNFQIAQATVADNMTRALHGMPAEAITLEVQAVFDKAHNGVVKTLLETGGADRANEYLAMQKTISPTARTELQAVVENHGVAKESLDLSYVIKTVAGADEWYKQAGKTSHAQKVRDDLVQRIEHNQVKARQDHVNYVSDVREQYSSWYEANKDKPNFDPYNPPAELRAAMVRTNSLGFMRQYLGTDPSAPGVLDTHMGLAVTDPTAFSQVNLSEVPGLAWKDEQTLIAVQRKIRAGGAEYTANMPIKRVLSENADLIPKNINLTPTSGTAVDARTNRFIGVLQSELASRQRNLSGGRAALTKEEEAQSVASAMRTVITDKGMVWDSTEPAYEVVGAFSEPDVVAARAAFAAKNGGKLPTSDVLAQILLLTEQQGSLKRIK